MRGEEDVGRRREDEEKGRRRAMGARRRAGSVEVNMARSNGVYRDDVRGKSISIGTLGGDDEESE